ncbi:hypothetical protein [Cryobacterium sp. Y57]|uniref:hypothetical protein n=1 Tax=Cryobacterium sp. Y57 TaxID=2048287 RepID=UPI000CE41259|nr:hypothetical protein [Cryobacterium sp. Y57]
MNLRRILCTLLVGAVCTVGLTACSPQRALTLAGIAIEKPTDVLVAMDETFIATVTPSGGTAVSIPDDARCYFQAADNDAVSPTALCGPIWYLGDDEFTWFSQGLDIDGEGIVTAEVGSPGAIVDDDKALFRTDGQAYDDDLEIAEPATANNVSSGASVQLASRSTGVNDLLDTETAADFVAASAAALITPDFTFGVLGGGTSPRVGDAAARYATTDKNEFAHIDLFVLPTQSALTVDGEYPALEVAADEIRYPVKAIDFGTILTSGTAADGAFGVSIPRGTKTLDLIVTYRGLEQTINIDRMARSSTTANAYYDGRQSTFLEQAYPESAVDAEGFSLKISGESIAALRSPFENAIWAEEGQVWVRTTLSMYEGGSLLLWPGKKNQADYYDDVLSAATLTLTDESGGLFTAAATTVNAEDLVVTSYFQVPEQSEGFTLGGTMQYDLTLRLYNGVTPNNADAPRSSTVDIPVPVYKVTFGKGQ